MSVFARRLGSRLIANNPTKINKNRSFSTCSVKLQKAELDEAHENGLQNVHTFVDLPETHQMLKDTCKQFAETELWPIAGEIDK